ncbi:DUF971 domain-containing protein [Cupriavidus sp. CP313]
MESAAHPVDVVFHQASGRLSVSWSDGLSGMFASPALRAACKCAGCESARRAGRAPVISPLLRLQAIHPMGEFGLQLVFEDGHDRGVYPWQYLRALSMDSRDAT